MLVYADASKEWGLSYVVTQEEGEWNKETGEFEPEMSEGPGRPGSTWWHVDQQV